MRPWSCNIFRVFLLLLLFHLCVPSSSGQDWLSAGKGKGAERAMPLRLLTYNVENLFDTVDNPLTQDDDFLPQGAQHWRQEMLEQKLHGVARVILDAGGLQPVDVVGLCEVESDSVVEQLLRRTRLARLGYEYVMSEGSDVRGINVAMLYQPFTFRLVSHRSLRVSLPESALRPTRDVLLCSGVLLSGDTLDIMQVHFPSRRGGAASSSPLRQAAVQTLLAAADSLRELRMKCRIVVMGDMNAEVSDPVLQPLFQHGFTLLEPQGDEEHHAPASYFFRDAWSNIDHCFVSGSFSQGSACIFARDYQLERSADGLYKPRRTFLGPAYHGGISDHLPILTTIYF